MPDDYHHTSVMTAEVLAGLAPHAGGVYVDATFGGGGHSRALLEASGPTGRVVALDRDPAALAVGAGLAAAYPGRLTLVHAPFGTLAGLALGAVQGVLFDLGVSSHQLDTPERGFSFQREGPLDMRMDPGGGLSAAELVNAAPERELADILFRLGEERHARRVARAIVAARPLETTAALAAVVARAVPGKWGAIHPATRSFQALRMAVNDELGELERGLQAALDLVAVGGRVAVIAFHSLEDRLVKQLFRERAVPAPPPGPLGWPTPPPPLTFRLVTKKPLVAGVEETTHNPRARSAKLRVVERIR